MIRMTVKKWSAFDWVLAIWTVLLAAMLLGSKIRPSFALFHATIGGQSVGLVLLSAWAWCVLIWLLRRVQLLAGVRFTKQNRLVLAAALFITAAYYIGSLLSRRFVYFWDYSFYYRMQLGVADNFRSDGFLTPVLNVIGSVWYEDYSSFINLFVAAPFALTPKTPNWFVACSAVTILPALYWAIAIYIKQLEQVLQIAHGAFFFAGSMVFAAGFPLLHRALLYGQPDLFGLILVFLILSLTVPYRFERIEPLRLLLLIVLTVMTCAARRWYLFWLVAYYGCYGIEILVGAIRSKRWGNLLRAVAFCAIAAVIVSAVLFPMLKRVLQTDYAGDYRFYNSGGLGFELKNQAGYLGAGLLVLLLGGILAGAIRKEARPLCLLTLGHGLGSMFLFTRIQNMGYHQSLILVPAYLTLLFLCLWGIRQWKRKEVFVCAAALALGFGSVNTAVCAAAEEGALSAPFSQVALALPKRNDIAQIQAVDRWLLENCFDTDTAYLIPHGYPYNPDIFRNCNLPDQSMISLLYYGSAVLGTHSFPTGLLTSKYVLTCDPFCDYGIAGKYNSAFFSEIPQRHFVEVKRFDMGNGYIFTVYQRIEPTDRKEIQFYQDYFAKEDALYPNLFSGVLNEIRSELNE